MANRSRRLRKKLHIDEFKEIGFTVSWSFKDGTDADTIDQILDKFIKEAIEPNGLAFEGSGYLDWNGLVCMEKLGNCNEQHRQIISEWLEKQGLTNVKTGKLLDIWWDQLDF